MVNALKSLLSFLLTWLQDNNVGFEQLPSYEASVRALMTKLESLGKMVEKEASEDHSRQQAAIIKKTFTARKDEAIQVLRQTADNLEKTLKDLELEGDKILNKTIKKAGY